MRLPALIYDRLAATQEALRLGRGNAQSIKTHDDEIVKLRRALDALTHRVNTGERDAHARYQYLDAAIVARMDRHQREFHEVAAETAKEAT